MKILLILLFLAISVVYIAETAVPINQIIFKSVYCNNSLPMFECNIHFQRKSKTAQMMVGNYTLKTVFTNDISLLLTVSYQDYSGIWKGLIMRNMHNTCDAFYVKGGTFNDQRKKYFVDTKDGCPAQPVFSKVGPTIVNRYRKDWEPDLKLLVPPYFIEADNWRATEVFYHKDDPTTVIGEITFEFRLINEHMSQ